MPNSVRIWGPGSLSNLGPGFDTLGVALNGVGDVVEVFETDGPGVTILPDHGASATPTDPTRNTAGRAALFLLKAFPGRVKGLGIRIYKGIRPGSGLGSSAASASAAALGALSILTDRSKEDAVEAALEGEAGVSGARHGDNVLPALLGGAVLTSASQPERYRRVHIPVDVHFAVIRPEVEVLTKEARDLLPQSVPLRDAVHNASSLAFLIDALRAGDLEEVGRAIEQDRIVEPVRAGLIPCYDAVLGAARESGALGAALSGSGPAMFALVASEAQAEDVCAAMQEACQDAGFRSTGLACSIDLEGARQTDLKQPTAIY